MGINMASIMHLEDQNHTAVLPQESPGQIESLTKASDLFFEAQIGDATNNTDNHNHGLGASDIAAIVMVGVVVVAYVAFTKWLDSGERVPRLDNAL